MNTEALEHIIRTQMCKRNTPGLAISVLKDGQSIYQRGFGVRDLKQQQPINADTLMGVGSISKSFCAFAIMQLQEMGKLSIDDSVADYLAFEPFLSRPAIAIKHLLSHTSGIPSFDAGMLGFHYTFDDFSRIYPATSRDDFIAHIADASDFIVFEPGEKFFYNNDLYSCLSFIIEQQSGMTYPEFARQEILEPLEMTRAAYDRQALDDDPEQNVMTGYRFHPQGEKLAAQKSDLPIGGYFPPRGGLYVSTNEMLNYAQCLIDGGVYKNKRLLSQESIDMLFSGVVSMPYGEGSNPKYGLGWCVESPSKQTPYRVIQHGGSVLTSQSFLMLLPELKFAVIATENASTGITPLIARVATALALQQNPDNVIEDLRLAKVLREVRGNYRSPYDMHEFTVSIDDGVLKANIETTLSSVSFPLLVDDLEKLAFKAYSLRSNEPDNSGKVQFYRHGDSPEVNYVTYDRYIYRRVNQ